MKVLLFIILIPFYAFGLDKLFGYPESIYVVRGYQIESSQAFKRNVELAYSPEQSLFGVSFYNDSDDNKTIIPTGTFNARACGLSASGVIVGINVMVKPDSLKDYKEIFYCKSPIFFRVMNPQGYSIYKIN